LPDNSSRSDVRKSLDIPDGIFIFLLLGRDPVIKGLDIFIKAAEETIQNEKGKVIFVIVGMEETRKVISAIPQESVLREAIRVIDPVSNFPLLLSGVDVFVSCSRSEGSPYAVLEAMAAQKIILSSNIPIPVVNGLHGRAEGVFVHPTEDWISLSEHMKQCLEMGQMKRTALGSANYKHVQEFYSVEIWAEKIRKIYFSLMRGI
jgi:glycosyltransferase involved in cell wall biosynthesis